jgi:hypothetical protein
MGDWVIVFNYCTPRTVDGRGLAKWGSLCRQTFMGHRVKDYNRGRGDSDWPLVFYIGRPDCVLTSAIPEKSRVRRGMSCVTATTILGTNAATSARRTVRRHRVEVTGSIPARQHRGWHLVRRKVQEAPALQHDQPGKMGGKGGTGGRSANEHSECERARMSFTIAAVLLDGEANSCVRLTLNSQVPTIRAA